MKSKIQITSGKGPEECSWVVKQLLKYVLKDAMQRSINTKISSLNEESEGLISSVCIDIKGDPLEIEKFLQKWVGSIKWIGESPFRPKHKRKNWYVAINKLDHADNELIIDENLIDYYPTRAGGPGGQHVNKVSTAIRAIYKPTGLCIVSSDERSQYQNKQKARERLLAALKKQQTDLDNANVKSNWKLHSELQRGNPVQIFKGKSFKCVK